MILERMGKAIRNPARDTMLSHATSAVGHGKGFGIHEALDQIGAVTGSLIVDAVYHFSGSYRKSFSGNYCYFYFDCCPHGLPRHQRHDKCLLST